MKPKHQLGAGEQTADDELPCSACVVGADSFRRMAMDVQEIKTALIGAPSMGHRGLVARVDALEQVTAAHSRKLYLWTGLAGAAGATLAFFKEKWLK